MPYVEKSAPKSKGSASFAAGKRSKPGVSVSPGKGGVNIGTPTHCESERSATNLKGVYA